MQTTNYLAVRLPFEGIGGCELEIPQTQLFAEFDEAFECIKDMVAQDYGYWIEDQRPKSHNPMTVDIHDFRYQIWVVKMPL